MDDTKKDRFITEWVGAYRDRLLRICFLILRNRADAEDAAQEAFIRAYKRLEAFRGDSEPLTWLTKIAMNCCRDQLRGAWLKRINRAVTPDDLPWLADDTEQNDVSVTLCVMNLPVKLREVVVLYYYQGYKMPEIAGILGVSQPTVSKRLKRAQSILRDELGEE